MTTLDEALIAARVRLPAAEARLLLSHVLAKPHAWLVAHGEETLNSATSMAFAELVRRRIAGEPIAYLLGSKEFFGREFAVSPAVLIPRPETELLVDLALQHTKGHPAPRILDLGCGSGCIAITLALELPNAQVTAVDRSNAALMVAAANGVRLGAPVRWLQSDWFSELAYEHFDLIVSNPPYVANADPHLRRGDLRYEPVSALAAGPDGLDDLRHILAESRKHLSAGGGLLCEHGYDQATAMAELLAATGFDKIVQHRDLGGIIRVSGGDLPASQSSGSISV